MSDGNGDKSPSPPDGRRLSPLRLLRLGAVVTLIIASVAGGLTSLWYQQEPSRQDLLEQADLGPKLLVGVSTDGPGISSLNPDTKRFQGFDIEIAHLIASDLGYQRDEVELLGIESEDRSRMQAKRGEDGPWVSVDLVIATYSITEERERDEGARFSEPYLETEQSVLTRIGHPPVPALANLRQEQVCVPTTTTSQPRAHTSGVTFIGKALTIECVTGLLAGDFDAVTTDAAILAGFVAQYPDQLRLHDIGESAPENWGVNARNEALRKLVDLSLYYSWCDPKDQRWEAAFDTYIAPLQRAIDDQPALPDALDPQQVAQAEQPEVQRPEVREWPWERQRCDSTEG